MTNNLEIAIMVWCICNIIWMVINMFLPYDDRISPDERNGKKFIFFGIIFSPLYALFVLWFFCSEYLSEPLFKERSIRRGK